jgi:hypothetical protein
MTSDINTRVLSLTVIIVALIWAVVTLFMAAESQGSQLLMMGGFVMLFLLFIAVATSISIAYKKSK